MINSINPASVPGYVQAQNGVSANNNSSVPIAGNYTAANQNLNGMNALAAYNQPASTAKPKVITPTLPTVLQPEAIKAIQGERIFSSTGELDTIISKNDKTTVIYKMDIQAPNDAISRIEHYDNASGKLLSTQENINKIEPGVMPQVISSEIVEINPDNGKISKFTIYTNGKLDAVREIEYAPNGDKKEYTVTDMGSAIFEKSANSNIGKTTNYDKDGKITEVITSNRDTGNAEIITYTNGIPSKIENKSDNNGPIANTTGKNPQADPDLIPSNPYILGYDPKTVQGDRTNYSNGALETINTNTENGFVMHRFKVNGDLSGILDARDPQAVKTVMFNTTLGGEKYTSVEEEISKGVYKTTVFTPDGTKEVSVMDSNTKITKHAFYSENGVMEHYGEYDKGDKYTYMEFNDKGELVEIS